MEIFSPVWMKKDVKRALKAVEKMVNQKQLVKVAYEAPLLAVRKAAVEKITDPAVLAGIALQEENEILLREAAIKKISDLSLPVPTAQKAKHQELLLEAIECISEQTLLANITRNLRNKNPIPEVIKGISDQALLARVAISLYNPADKLTGNERFQLLLESISDQSALRIIVKHSPYEALCLEALERITDPFILADIAKSRSYNERIVHAAIKRISDPSALASLYKNSQQEDHYDTLPPEVSNQALQG